MYAILIRNNPRDHMLWKFFTVKKEIYKTYISTITDESTGESKQVTTQRPTGQYKQVRYTTDKKDELESVYIKLTQKYPRANLLPISIETYFMDLIFDSDSPSEDIPDCIIDIDGDGVPDELEEATNDDIDNLFN